MTRIAAPPFGWTDLDPRTARRTPLGAVVSAVGPDPVGPDVAPVLMPLVVVDVTARVAHSGGDFLLAPLHLRTWEQRHVRIPRGACVVLRTGCPDGVPAPGLSDDAVAWLRDRRQVAAFGSDAVLPAPSRRAAEAIAVIRCDPAALARCRPHGDWVCATGATTVVLRPVAPAVPHYERLRDPR